MLSGDAGRLFADHLGAQFDHFDEDGSNELDHAELLLLFNSLQLRLSLQQIMSLRTRMDEDSSVITQMLSHHKFNVITLSLEMRQCWW